jgi:hypothetical protein
MDVTEDKFKKLLKRAKYVVGAWLLHSVVIATLLLTLAGTSVGSELLLEMLYGSAETWYLRLGLHFAKLAAFLTEIYLYMLFLADSIAHANRDR